VEKRARDGGIKTYIKRMQLNKQSENVHFSKTADSAPEPSNPFALSCTMMVLCAVVSKQTLILPPPFENESSWILGSSALRVVMSRR
jgi:hypothetical protein